MPLLSVPSATSPTPQSPTYRANSIDLCSGVSQNDSGNSLRCAGISCQQGLGCPKHPRVSAVYRRMRHRTSGDTESITAREDNPPYHSQSSKWLAFLTTARQKAKRCQQLFRMFEWIVKEIVLVFVLSPNVVFRKTEARAPLASGLHDARPGLRLLPSCHLRPPFTSLPGPPSCPVQKQMVCRGSSAPGPCLILLRLRNPLRFRALNYCRLL